MKHTYSLLMAILSTIVILFSGCDEKESLPITFGLTNSPKCKSLDKSATLDEKADSLSCVEYSYNSSTETLTLKHINAGFNCCPDKISFDATFRNDTLIVEESETSSFCDCNCLYDLEMEIKNFTDQRFQVKFIEPYRGNGEELIFEINLKTNKSGEWCVTRKNYPWGTNSMY
jgi:hypothetical protein